MLWRRGPKRLFDVLASSLLLVLFAPLLILAALVVRASLGSPVLFRQMRPGRGEQPFTLIKFRTMTHQRGRDGKLLPDGERLPRIGRLLRNTSVDELPGLVNVLRGDMSLVGPRPLLMQYLPLYSPAQRRRHEVRPGITGLAQVNGRNSLAWEERFELDVEYVDRCSMRLDFSILAATVSKVFRREGISARGEATMAPFSGSSRVAHGSSDSGSFVDT